eukprot:m51a1_g5766 putative sac domain-containing inositol phosphatase 3 (907) ;mRNA; f:1233804-1237233
MAEREEDVGGYCLHAPPTTIEHLVLYESRSRFFLVGSNDDGSRARILKVERTSEEVAVSEDPREYTLDEATRLLAGHPVALRARALLGFARLLAGPYMVLAVERRRVGDVGGHAVYAVEQAAYVYVPEASSVASSTSCGEGPAGADASEAFGSGGEAAPRAAGRVGQREGRYRDMLMEVDLANDFFWSHTYNLTRSLQYNMRSCCRERPPPPSPAFAPDARGPGDAGAAPADAAGRLDTRLADRFMWNYQWVLPLVRAGISAPWIVPLTHGYFRQETVSHHGESLGIALIARRSRKYAGARFLKRGVSESGDVANDVEVEQILQDGSRGVLGLTPNMSSYVQMRGSIPLFWSQDISKYAPKPPIRIDREDPFYTASILHFQDLFRRYGTPIVILNLIKAKEKTPREALLLPGFAACVDFLNRTLPPEHAIIYTHWDLHAALKSKKDKYLDELISKAKYVLERTGIFHSGPRTYRNELNSRWNTVQDSAGSVSTAGGCEQRGVLRCNCIDSLDRTNAAQFFIGKSALGHQLYEMGLLQEPSVALGDEILDVLVSLYEGMGNKIALQYGGSELANTMTTYTKQSIASQGRDLLATVRRYYRNSFTDAEKQSAINVFLGVYNPRKEPLDIWEMATDYYLHNTPQPELAGRPPLSSTRWWEAPLRDFLFRPRSLGVQRDCAEQFHESYSPSSLTSFDEVFAYQGVTWLEDKNPKKARVLADSPAISHSKGAADEPTEEEKPAVPTFYQPMAIAKWLKTLQTAADSDVCYKGSQQKSQNVQVERKRKITIHELERFGIDPFTEENRPTYESYVNLCSAPSIVAVADVETYKRYVKQAQAIHDCDRSQLKPEPQSQQTYREHSTPVENRSWAVPLYRERFYATLCDDEPPRVRPSWVERGSELARLHGPSEL